MKVTDQIQRLVERLPTLLQAEVLAFVKHLAEKVEQREGADPPEMSLTLALRGMEDEEKPTYTLADLKEVFH